jgi:hypothetical protein
MKTISRYIIIAVLAFFALDWIAENPAKIKQARNQLEKVLEVSGSVIASQYEAASRELDKQ